MKTILLFGSGLSLFALTDRAEQQKAGALPIEAVIQSWKFTQTQPIRLSPDGQWVAFTLQRSIEAVALPEESHYWLTLTGAPFLFAGSDIWIANTRTGASKNLTDGKGTSWAPAWSPDGRYLAFNSDRSGASHPWLWEMSSGKLREVSHVSATFTYGGLQWTPDGRQLVVPILPEGLSVQDLFELLRSNRFDPVTNHAEGEVSRNKGARTTARVMESNPASVFNMFLSDLALIEITTGEMRRIGRQLRPLWWQVSPDGAYVAAMSVVRQEAFNSLQTLYELSLMSLVTNESQILGSNIQWQWRTPISWSPDGKGLAYATGGPNATSAVFFVPLSDGPPRRLTPVVHPDFRAPTCLLWDAHQESIYSITQDAMWKFSLTGGPLTKVASVPNHSLLSVIARRSSHQIWRPKGRESAVLLARNDITLQEGFYEVDLNTGLATQLLEEGKSFGEIDLSEDDKTVACVAEDARHPQEIWVMNEGMRGLQQVTNMHPEFNSYVFGATRLVNWTSNEGVGLKGSLLLPVGFQESKRYPLIVNVYGGSNLSVSLNRWDSAPFNMQLFATRGYAVLLPDAPQKIGTPMQDLAKTVLPGVQKVVELGIADPDHLGLIGYSYGGYSTLALIVQSKRFRAAVDIDGLTNLMNAYAKPGIGGGAIAMIEEGQGKIGSSLWERRDRFIENSPLFYLERVETPLLLIQGASDTTDPPIESEIAFGSLRRLGKEVTYIEYQGDHVPSLWSYVDQVDYCKRVIAWLDKFLKEPSSRSPGDSH